MPDQDGIKQYIRETPQVEQDLNFDGERPCSCGDDGTLSHTPHIVQ